MLRKPVVLMLTILSGTSAMAIEIPGRGGTFFDSPERFNRYYTDPQYSPAKTYYVSSNGSGDGSAGNPMSVDESRNKMIFPDTCPALATILPGHRSWC
ncbi:hypothetical protein [Thiolapillus sp.]|uniref:hypothetical protein n=1 Tax=Thiolapillus sp. TaxID=2017437 RepID=UPI003AF5790E